MMKKIFLSIIGASLLLFGANETKAYLIKYSFIVTEIDTYYSSISNPLSYLGNNFNFVVDYDLQAYSYDETTQTTTIFADTPDRDYFAVISSQQLVDYQNDSDPPDFDYYQGIYDTLSGDDYFSLYFHEDTDNLIKVWTYGDDSDHILNEGVLVNFVDFIELQDGDRVSIEGIAKLVLVENLSLDPPSIPEPTTIFLLGSALIGLVGFRRKFKK